LRWKLKRKSKTEHHGSCPCGVLGVLASCCRFSRKILFFPFKQQPHKQKYMRRRAALICSYIPLIVGVVLFYAGCDETLKPWCTENRHSGWQGIAMSRCTASVFQMCSSELLVLWPCRRGRRLVSGSVSRIIGIM
jgi:hypothetical protein